MCDGEEGSAHLGGDLLQRVRDPMRGVVVARIRVTQPEKKRGITRTYQLYLRMMYASAQVHERELPSVQWIKTPS